MVVIPAVVRTIVVGRHEVKICKTRRTKASTWCINDHIFIVLLQNTDQTDQWKDFNCGAWVESITCKPRISIGRRSVFPSPYMLRRGRDRRPLPSVSAGLTTKWLRSTLLKAQIFRGEGLLGELLAESFPNSVQCSTLCRIDKEKNPDCMRLLCNSKWDIFT